MKRALLLVFAGAFVVGIVFFPVFRRAIFQRLRLILLILSGSLLLAALGRLFIPGAGPPLTSSQQLWGSFGTLVLAVSFSWVVWDAARKGK
jgi:hypothetical protein